MDERREVPSRSQLDFILGSAILAPSADNRHFLRFEIVPNGLKAYYTGEALPAPGGYRRVLALLSLGAVAENLTIAASRFGIGTELRFLCDSAHPGLIFQVFWHSQSIESDVLWEEISRRHTNRRVWFRGPRLNAGDQAMLRLAVQAYPGCDLEWVDAPERKSQVIGLMRQAEGMRYRIRTLHDELFSSIRFDVGWKQSCAEGLPPGALGIEWPLHQAFTWLRHWSVMQLFNALGGGRLMEWRTAALPGWLAPHLAVISVEQTEDDKLFDAGRAFQRSWLILTKLGFVLQPFPAASLFALSGATTEGVPSTLQEELRRTWQKLLPSQRHPIMIFRAGRAPISPVVTGRKELENYLIGPMQSTL